MSKKQKNINQQIMQFISDKQAKGDVFTNKDKTYIQQYTGGGGLGYENRGSLYEFYTDPATITAMWALAYKHGFTNGMILEPACGTGRFLKYVDPAVNTVDAFEFSKDNKDSYTIASICYPWANITNNYFESIFYDGERRKKDIEPIYDCIIGNPPYGKWTGYYAGSKREGAIYKQHMAYDHYFLTACIDLLKPGGVIVFLIQGTFLTNGSGSYNDVKTAILEKADFMEAYLLPKGTFEFTQVSGEIVVFKKK